MKFVIQLFQEGGCDYTIGCGQKNVKVDASSNVELDEKILETIEYYGRDNIDYVTVFKVDTELKIDIDELFAKKDEEIKAKKEAEKEAEERAQLIELQKKYPDLK